MQSLEAVLRSVAGRGESSQMAGGRMRRRRGEASSSVHPLDEDAGTSQAMRSGRSSRRTRGSHARSPSPEDEEEQEQDQDQEVDQQEQEQEDQEEDQQQQDQDQEEEEEASSEEDDDQGGVAGDIPAIWMRGPARLPNRPIPLEQQPIIRPDGKR